ncbi:MAG TPA: alkaline phosphatase family protein [Solirubrobacteraceae bacterium]|nr:alkaline phosphatase family protein [Solirubrobacteraceae bacterium]
MTRTRRFGLLLVLAAMVGAISVAATTAAAHRSSARHDSRPGHGFWGENPTRTPIKHVVVIYGENVSFDHYFGTYPTATNTDGQPFHAAPGTPAVNGLPASTPNSAQPQRLDSSATGAAAGPGNGQLTCDQDHNYSDEQKAFDNGKMDKFVQSVGTAGGTSPGGTPCQAKQVMDYYDGNTVTGLWNYAQHYAMSDNSFGTTFGPSSPGAINLAAGDTGNVDMTHTANRPSIATPTSPNADLTPDGQGGYSLTSDAQPYWDDCSTRDAVALNGTNIGDSLNRAGLSWGWFEGGFRPTTSYADALAATGHSGQPTSTFIADEFKAAGLNSSVPHAANQGICNAVSPIGQALGGNGQYGYKDDYIAHHEPFQYYASTANPHHLTIPQSGGQDTLAGLATVGRDTQSYSSGQPQFNTPNHNYDTSDFDQLLSAISAGQLPASALPAVSFLKAPGYQDGHAGYSDPADEQQFVVKEINALMKSPDWSSTAVFVNYDDSDGWYDHVYSGVTNPSTSVADNLTNTTLSGPTSGLCTGPGATSSAPLAGEQGRCGLGPRLPMLVISPYAKPNDVDHNLSDQASIINFVEYNWRLPGIPGSADQVLAGRTPAYTGPQPGRMVRDGRGPGDGGGARGFDLAGMFRFDGGHGYGDGRGDHPDANTLILDPSTGQPVAGSGRPWDTRRRHAVRAHRHR